MNSILIRPAKTEEAELLSDIAFKAKGHWGYSNHLMELWRCDMLITAEIIEQQTFFVAESAHQQSGFVGIAKLHAGDERNQNAEAELTDLWVLPEQMGNGIGKRLLEKAIEFAHSCEFGSMLIASDPNAVSFYQHFGARQIGWRQSKPAERRLPLLRINLGKLQR